MNQDIIIHNEKKYVWLEALKKIWDGDVELLLNIKKKGNIFEVMEFGVKRLHIDNGFIPENLKNAIKSPYNFTFIEHIAKNSTFIYLPTLLEKQYTMHILIINTNNGKILHDEKHAIDSVIFRQDMVGIFNVNSQRFLIKMYEKKIKIPNPQKKGWGSRTFTRNGVITFSDIKLCVFSY